MTKHHQYDQQIIQLYKSDHYMKMIARKLNVDTCVVKRVLKENNIPLKTKHYRKHLIKEDFFDLIDQEEKSYILGFLFADGCVRKDKCNICLCIKDTDRAILIKIVSCIFTGNQNIIITKQSKQKPFNYYSAININSKYMIRSLINLGCTPAKSLTLKFPEILTDEIICRHFIRGYFDGDGCITRKNKVFTITSTLSFCNTTKSIIEKYTGAQMHVYKYKNVYRLTAHGRNQVIKICNWLYLDSTIYLQRKCDIFNNIKSEKTNYFSDKTINTFISYRNSGLTYNVIGKMFNCSGAGVAKAIKRIMRSHESKL